MSEVKGDIIKVIISAVLLVVVYFLPVGEIAKLLLFLIPYGIAGYETIIEAVEGIVKGELLDENFLMTIATIGAFAIGDYPEAVFVMLFYQVGEIFEHIAVGKSRRSIADLMDIKPDVANLFEDGSVREIPAEDVKAGDILIIRPGEKVPVDGVVIEGASSLNTMALTGESVPRDIKADDQVVSGSINESGLLKIKATRSLSESTVTRILKLVEESSQSKAKTEGFITRFAQVYTPIVVGLAVLLVAVPSILWGDFSAWLNKGLIFLVVSCPCALVISVPLAYFAGIGGASRHGVLVKGANYLEALGMADTMVFDKTGTLTQGKFKVAEIECQGIEREQLLKLAASIEKYSTHPIAMSIKQEYQESTGKNCENLAASNVKELAGMGIQAEIDGKKYYAGNLKLMESLGITPTKLPEVGTVIYLSQGGTYLGAIAAADIVKEDSKDAIKDLKKCGIKNIIMLTGDRKAAADSVGRELGIDQVYSELMPQDKVEIFQAICQKSKKKVAFVGDGINDAPVLARADAGIAMGALGSDAAIEAADVVLMEDRISKIPLAIAVSKKTKRIVWENIIFALAIKAAVLILAALGVATMWEAVFADVGVTAIAVLNSIRALKEKDASN